MQPAINFTVSLSYNGHHYAGIAAHNGVGFELVDAPCGNARQLISFPGCSVAPTGIFFDAVSCVDSGSAACPLYLNLYPDV